VPGNENCGLVSSPSFQPSEFYSVQFNAEKLHASLLGRNIYSYITGMPPNNYHPIFNNHPAFEGPIGQQYKQLIEALTIDPPVGRMSLKDAQAKLIDLEMQLDPKLTVTNTKATTLGNVINADKIAGTPKDVSFKKINDSLTNLEGVSNQCDKLMKQISEVTINGKSLITQETLQTAKNNAMQGAQSINELSNRLGVLETKLKQDLVKLKSAFVLADPNGYNFVNSVEERNGTYIIKGSNSSGEPRSITIHANGNATGFDDSNNLGLVGQQMYDQREAVFKHFNIPLPKVISEPQQQSSVSSKTPVAQPEGQAPKVTVKEAIVKGPFILQDIGGENFIDSVAEHNGTYTITGRNSSQQTRKIIIDKDGNVTGFQSKGYENLGNVEKQMYDAFNDPQERLLQHFDMKKSPQNVGELPLEKEIKKIEPNPQVEKKPLEQPPQKANNVGEPPLQKEIKKSAPNPQVEKKPLEQPLHKANNVDEPPLQKEIKKSAPNPQVEKKPLNEHPSKENNAGGPPLQKEIKKNPPKVQTEQKAISKEQSRSLFESLVETLKNFADKIKELLNISSSKKEENEQNKGPKK
jgi:hypothetical protein